MVPAVFRLLDAIEEVLDLQVRVNQRRILDEAHLGFPPDLRLDRLGVGNRLREVVVAPQTDVTRAGEQLGEDFRMSAASELFGRLQLPHHFAEVPAHDLD